MPNPSSETKPRAATLASSSDQILRAALECFVEQGYAGTSVRDIAARAGISVAGLYHHHDSKRVLLERLMETTMDDLVLVLDAALEGAGPDPVDRFEAVIEAHVRFHCERPEESFVGNSELRSLEPEARQRVIGKRDEVQDFFAVVVDGGNDAGVFAVARPHATSRALASMCVAVSSWYRRDGELGAEEIVAIYRDLGLQLVGYRPAGDRSPCRSSHQSTT